MIYPCDRQTDGQAIAYSALSIYAMLSRAKNDDKTHQVDIDRNNEIQYIWKQIYKNQPVMFQF